jgi:Fe-S-cluster containining protein
MDNCNACGKCCKKHWLLRLTSDKEIKLFGKAVVFGKFIWTDECKFQNNDGKCKIHGEKQPFMCREYFCENNLNG